jgi:hypothetical protein
MAEWSKALHSGCSPLLWAWVQIPLLTHNYFFNGRDFFIAKVMAHLIFCVNFNFFFVSKYCTEDDKTNGFNQNYQTSQNQIKFLRATTNTNYCFHIKTDLCIPKSQKSGMRLVFLDFCQFFHFSDENLPCEHELQ